MTAPMPMTSVATGVPGGNLRIMKLPMSANGAVRFIQWVVFAVLIGYGFGWMPSAPYYTLADRLRAPSVTAPAKITAVSPGNMLNSPTATYTYEFAGRSYDGYSPISNGVVHSLEPGASAKVYVDPASPKDSALDPDAMTVSANWGLVIAGVLEVIVALIFWAPFIAKRFKGTKIDGSKASALVLVGVMLAVGLGMLFFSAIPTLMKSIQLFSRSATATAEITAVYDRTEGGGRYAVYAFTVDGKGYQGETDTKAGYGERGKITVHYLPSDPSFSAPDPAGRRDNATGGVIFLCIWNLLVGGILFMIVRHPTVKPAADA